MGFQGSLILFLIMISGPSGTGKTSVAEQIIEALSRSGIRTSFIKDIPHDDAEFDSRGKDTYRAVTRGAVMSIGRSPSRSFINIGGFVDLKELLKFSENNSGVCIVEGFIQEASAIKFDAHIDLQTRQSGGKSSAVYARVEVGSQIHEFRIINGSADLANFIVSFIEDIRDSGKSA